MICFSAPKTHDDSRDGDFWLIDRCFSYETFISLSMKKILNVRSRDLNFILSVALNFSLTSLLSLRYNIACYHKEMLYDIQQYYDSKWRTSFATTRTGDSWYFYPSSGLSE